MAHAGTISIVRGLPGGWIRVILKAMSPPVEANLGGGPVKSRTSREQLNGCKETFRN